MGDAGTGRFEYGRATRDLSISLGRKGRGAFIPGEDEFDGRRVLPLLVPADGCLARQSEHTPDLVQFQHPQNDLRSVHPCHVVSFNGLGFPHRQGRGGEVPFQAKWASGTSGIGNSR